MKRIQPADPNARRKAQWTLGIAAMAGLCTILVFEYYQEDFQAWLERNIDYLARHPFIVFLAALVSMLPIMAASIYLLLLGNRIVRARRFPPPDFAVVRDTAVLEGTPGVRRGRMIQLLSILLLLVSCTVPFVLWSIFRAIGNSG